MLIVLLNLKFNLKPMITPITPIRLKLWKKEEIKRRTKNLSKWVEEAIDEKFDREPYKELYKTK